MIFKQVHCGCIEDWNNGSTDLPTDHLQTEKEKGHHRDVLLYLEATTGFEPVDIGFANQSLKPLGYVAKLCEIVLISTVSNISMYPLLSRLRNEFLFSL